MKRFAAALLAMLFLSCDPVIRKVLVLTFNDAADLVTISATTSLGTAKAGTPEEKQIADMREQLLAGNDEWSARFAHADPESDRVVLDRRHGELQSLEHVASINPDNLQKFFFDTHLTVTFTRGEGWAELTIYPGTSDRATRRQRDNVDRLLTTYSERAAHYFQTIRGFYAYLNEKPHRAHDMFVELFRDEKDNDAPPRVSETEEKIINGVRDAIDTLGANNEDTANLDRDFDVVFNPFPAEMKIAIPGTITAIEGFTRQDRTVAVIIPSALEAVSMLEGRWITPDPLAAALSNKTSAEIADELAAAPRHTEPVTTPSEIADALKEKMRPADRYRVRWTIKELRR